MNTGNLYRISLNYGHHLATIYIAYQPCETSGETCNRFEHQSGDGYEQMVIPGPNHVQDRRIYVSMTNYGTDYDNVFVSAQVTEPRSGSLLHGTDNDGYVSKAGHISNPNARSESRAEITFKSYHIAEPPFFYYDEIYVGHRHDTRGNLSIFSWIHNV